MITVKNGLKINMTASPTLKLTSSALKIRIKYQSLLTNALFTEESSPTLIPETISLSNDAIWTSGVA